MRHLQARPSVPAFPRHLLSTLCMAIGLAAASTGASAAVDESAANALYKDNDCNKCHHPTKKKKGPSLKAIAEKYKGDAGAESKLIKHITSRSKVKIEGEEEVHPVPSTNDPKQLKNFVNWVLSQ